MNLRHVTITKTKNQMKTKIFFDTEFTGLHQGTTLISIGFVSECDKTFYAELTDYDKEQINDWIDQNVLSKLLFLQPPIGQKEHYMAKRHYDNKPGNDLYESYSLEVRCTMRELKKHLTKWLSQFQSVEMWSDCLSYDWVLFCNIFGSAFDIPEHIYYIPFDICTLLKDRGIDPDINREKYGCGEVYSEMPKHNARWDARVIKMCYEKLTAQTKK